MDFFLCSSDELICSVCLDLLNDPVTLGCGHSFCLECVNQYWACRGGTSTYICPNCREVFPQKPQLKKNVIIASMVTQMNLGVEEQAKRPICPDHGKLIQLYCKDDDSLMCFMCMTVKHQQHKVVAVEVAHAELKQQFEISNVPGHLTLVVNLIIVISGGLVASQFEIGSKDVFLLCLPDGRTPTLDHISAHPNLLLSKDLKMATKTSSVQPHPDHPLRFDFYTQVLTTESFSSGRHYWEVDISRTNRCEIGAVYDSISRKGYGSECSLGGNLASWCLRKWDGKYAAWHNGKRVLLNLMASPSRLGLCLDYEAGELVCYGDDTGLLHTFKATFNQPLLPALSLVIYNKIYKLKIWK
uniref:Uncharacterized protein n=1 Tax=Eptatretus burgeri TaxID=7764 RepID=A0A8C4NLI7_EPTBU